MLRVNQTWISITSTPPTPPTLPAIFSSASSYPYFSPLSSPCDSSVSKILSSVHCSDFRNNLNKRNSSISLFQPLLLFLHLLKRLNYSWILNHDIYRNLSPAINHHHFSFQVELCSRAYHRLLVTSMTLFTHSFFTCFDFDSCFIWACWTKAFYPSDPFLW